MFLVIDSNDIVRTIATVSQDIDQPAYAGMTQITVADDDPRVTAFLAAQQAAFKPRPTPLQWLRRLTLDKQQAIFAAAATNPVVLGWLFEADGVGGGIDVTDPLTIQGVTIIGSLVPQFTADDQALLLAP